MVIQSSVFTLLLIYFWDLGKVIWEKLRYIRNPFFVGLWVLLCGTSHGYSFPS